MGKMAGSRNRIWYNAGAPVDGTSGTFAGECFAGDLLSDTTNGILYMNTGTTASPSWTPVSGGGGGSFGALEIRNETGGALSAGTLVSLSGWNETQGKFLVVKADADVNGQKADLILPAAINNNANGIGVSRLRLTGQNTGGRAVGDPVYLDTATAGGFTFTAPSGADDIVQVIGYVAVVHASTGVIEIALDAPTKVGTNDVQDDAITSAKMTLSLPFTIPLPFTLDYRGGSATDGVLVGVLTRSSLTDCTQEDNSGASFVDETADAASAGANDVQMPDPFDTNDAIYFGYSSKFTGLAIVIGTQGAGDAVESETIWEYWNGSAWSSLEAAGNELRDDSTAFTAAAGTRILTFKPPANWATTTVDGGPSAYFIRLRATANDVYNTTQPVLTQILAMPVDAGQGLVVPFAGTITAVDMAARVASATNDDTELLIINKTQGTFAQVTWTGADAMDRVTGLSLAVAAGDELVIQQIAEDGTTEFADCVLSLTVAL